MVLPEFFLRFRNRLLADLRFHRLMQRFAPTRYIARQKSVQLFDLLAGFSYSQVLYACVDLKVFHHVGLAGCNASDLATATGLTTNRCDMLVKAAQALSLLERRADRIMLGEYGAVILAQPWIIRFVEHHKFFYHDLANPSDLLRGVRVAGGLHDYWNYSDPTTHRTPYSELMAASQAAVSEQILAGFDFRPYKRLLDIGGGSGAFVRAVGDHSPDLELNVFDLPGVASLVQVGNPPHIRSHSGNFLQDSLPTGMDLISLVRVVHDHDDEPILALFRNIRAAVAPGTTLLIAEPFSGNPKTARVTDAYFNFYFAAMGQGRTRSPQEIADLAQRANFGSLRIHPSRMPLITGIISLKAT